MLVSVVPAPIRPDTQLTNGTDAEDNPPSTCSVDLNRDCGAGGCIVSAIANYVCTFLFSFADPVRKISSADRSSDQTQRVNDRRYSIAHRKEYLEFLVHFIGDITQPLHAEAKAVGGNQIPVLWAGNPTNLHSTWDTQMVEKDAGGYDSAATAAFANRLIAAIDSGAYASQKASWISCSDVATASACALNWAQDANRINCGYVLKVDQTNQELSGAYYTGAKPYIELQIAKGGYRLGTWINRLAAAA
ncbi:MAG: hypothetical protein LQ348_001482 [Seirophora lacunosa]|nr:MAG: hypothetical protein LQ344_002006 [Seirophora lacunosa]KAI4202603.1 MAG: hypothetical protein LQ348_001482 [Seirophora lacunosa]